MAQAAGQSDVGALAKQALSLLEAGRTADAEAAVQQAFGIQAQRRPDPRVTSVLDYILGAVYAEEGRFKDAEPLLKASIDLVAGTAGHNPVADVAPISTLASIYIRQGRYPDAEPLLVRALDLTRKRFGKRPQTAESLNSLASLYSSMGRPDLAEPLLADAMDILGAAGPDLRDEFAAVVGNYGVVEQTLHRYPEALAHYHDAYMANLAIHGADHPFTMNALSNAGVIYGLMGEPAQGEPLLETALAFATETYGKDSLQTAHAQTALGWIELGLNNAPAALDNLRPAVGTYLRIRALQQRTGALGGGVSERETGRAILGLLRAVALSGGNDAHTTALADEAFRAVQAAHDSKAGNALAQTTARFATGDDELAGLIRQEQDLARRWATLDTQLTASYGSPAAARSIGAEAQARATLADTESRIGTIDATLRQRFPSYAGLAAPQPLSIGDVQGRLAADEALVTITAFGGENGEGTAVFVVTRETARWRLIDAGSTELKSRVLTLLCGLDADLWSENGAAHCSDLTHTATPAALLPFDAGAANQLYVTLFGELAPMLAGKTLLVVASDPLASLPLQVLVTEPPAAPVPSTAADLQAVAWLGRSNPIAVLPSVGSLQGLRVTTQIARATLPFIGFGDPTLSGSRRCPKIRVAGACPNVATLSTEVASLSRGSGDALAAVYRGGEVDVDAVRALCPLPDTALELRCVADSVGADISTVHTGGTATLAGVRGAGLNHYRVIEFATHGLVAGALKTAEGALAEPVLVLTPDSGVAGDDGLLRASEIATLSLNADWVVLSACNTAAADQLGGESMSGLASAFLYAGARSLLVSHWSVRSDTTVRLTTRAFREMADDARVGRAEALRRSIAAMIDSGGDADAHPSAWAPFSLVGANGPMQGS